MTNKNISKKAEGSLTVVICCYNAKKYLSQCLESIKQQSQSKLNVKILLVDDASTDKSLEIANEYKSSLQDFHIIKNNENKGLVRCCNGALDLIDTEYFMRLDADDYLSKNAFERIYDELNKPDDKDFVIFYRYDDTDGNLQEVEIDDDIYTWIAAGNVFKTKAVRSVAGYSYEYWEEYDLFTKLKQKGYKYIISPQHVYYYRRGHESMTKNREMIVDGIKSLQKKWPRAILNQYGNFSRLIEYYGIEEIKNG